MCFQGVLQDLACLEGEKDWRVGTALADAVCLPHWDWLLVGWGGRDKVEFLAVYNAQPRSCFPWVCVL